MLKEIRTSKKWLFAALAIVCTVGLSIVIIIDNVHTVIPGKIYRSGQLDATTFKWFVAHYHIQSILNLRGSNPDKIWYQQERVISKELGIHHYDLPMGAYHLPTISMLKQLVKIIDTAPKPILMHCASGADRVGLASAIALLLQNAPLATAMRQLSLYYFVYSDHSVGKLTLPYYTHWLEQNHLRTSRQHFLQWISKVKFSS